MVVGDCVYVITCQANGKKYVGQTANFVKRKRSHLSPEPRNQTPLARAVRKHGVGAFTWIMMSVRREDRDATERLMIEMYGTCVPDGYNLETGGHAKKTAHESTKARLSVIAKKRFEDPGIRERLRTANVGRKLAPESVAKLSAAGKNRSPEYREKIRQANLRNWQSPEYRARQLEKIRSRQAPRRPPRVYERRAVEPGMIVSKSDFAYTAGVTRAAISIALKAGRVVATADGRMDPADVLNATYLASPRRQRRQAQRQTGRTPGGKPTALGADPGPQAEPGLAPGPVVRPSGGIGRASGGNGRRGWKDDAGDDGESYYEADRRKKVADADKVEIANAKARGELIDRELVLRFLNHLYIVDTTELRPLGDRLGAKLAGIARSAASDDQAAIEINKTLTDDVYRSLSHIQSMIDEYLAAGAPEDKSTVAPPAPQEPAVGK